uniref:Uncharacterized protein n=1 Tax=Glossina pallidipes TaxID=7398 RepID=A0A1B0A9D1_GLOPL
MFYLRGSKRVDYANEFCLKYVFLIPDLVIICCWDLSSNLHFDYIQRIFMSKAAYQSHFHAVFFKMIPLDFQNNLLFVYNHLQQYFLTYLIYCQRADDNETEDYDARQPTRPRFTAEILSAYTSATLSGNMVLFREHDCNRKTLKLSLMPNKVYKSMFCMPSVLLRLRFQERYNESKTLRGENILNSKICKLLCDKSRVCKLFSSPKAFGSMIRILFQLRVSLKKGNTSDKSDVKKSLKLQSMLTARRPQGGSFSSMHSQDFLFAVYTKKTLSSCVERCKFDIKYSLQISSLMFACLNTFTIHHKSYHDCLGCCGGGGGVVLKHCSKKAKLYHLGKELL